MRVKVPHNDSLPLVTIILFTPQGEISTTVDNRHYSVDIPLPDGVQEDEVDVYSCFLGADHRPPFGCGPAMLKAATRKPASAPAPAVEPAPVAPLQEPEPAPAAELEADTDDEPAPIETESAGS